MTSMLQELLPQIDGALPWGAASSSFCPSGLSSPGRSGPGPVAAPASPAWSPTPWLRLLLDAIDYGAGVLLPDGTLAYANAALQARLAGDGGLRLDAARRLRADTPADDQRLAEARLAACARGLRRLVPLGRNHGALALIGVAGTAPGAEQACLLLAQRAAPCERLSMALFARQHALTHAEARVLQGLTEGHSPEDLGLQLGVKITTVRTHITHLRAKTGEASLRDLMRCMATLPPVVSALRQGPGLGL